MAIKSIPVWHRNESGYHLQIAVSGMVSGIGQAAIAHHIAIIARAYQGISALALGHAGGLAHDHDHDHDHA